MSVIKWRIYCETESNWVEGYLNANDGAPITCFNNNSHTVNLQSQQELLATQLLNVKVVQETIPTGGHYASQGFSMSIAANSAQTLQISWPFPITTILVHLQPMSQNLGDVLNAIIAPMSNIGIITSNVAIGATTAVVSSTVIANSAIGFNFYIDTESLGRITQLDTDTNVITFETPTTLAHTANDLVYADYTIIRNFMLGLNNGNDLGLGSIAGKSLPGNMPTNIVYQNNENIAKTFHFMIEYLF